MAFATFTALPSITTSPCTSRAFQPKRARSISTPCRCRRRVPRARLEEPAPRTSTAPSSSPLSSSSGYNWADQWYPVTFERDVLDDVPYPFSVFERKLVLFRARPGEYSILDDRCSHRLAPLSEGRIIAAPNDAANKVIECAYHGWSFKGCGECACIPQLTAGATIPRRSSVRSYVSEAYLGVVWVWLGDASEADVTLLPTGRMLDAEGVDGVTLKMNWSRIVPYGFEALLENVLDPVHVHWAHHGAREFFRRERGVTKTALAVNLLGDMGMNSGGLHYHAPVTCVYAYDMLPYLDVMFCVSPISRHTSRMFMIDIHKSAQPPLPFVQRISWKNIRNALRPVWAEHLEVCMTTDGDNVLVHEVERNLEAQGDTESWRTAYLPIHIDGLVVALRKWMDSRRGEIPWVSAVYDSAIADTFTKHAMIERWESHTKHCQVCSGALRGWQRMDWVVDKALHLAMLFLVLIVAATAAILVVTDDMLYLDRAADRLLLKPAIISSVVLLVLVLVLWRFRKMCRYYIAQFNYTDEARERFLTV